MILIQRKLKLAVRTASKHVFILTCTFPTFLSLSLLYFSPLSLLTLEIRQRIEYTSEWDANWHDSDQQDSASRQNRQLFSSYYKYTRSIFKKILRTNESLYYHQHTLYRNILSWIIIQFIRVHIKRCNPLQQWSDESSTNYLPLLRNRYPDRAQQSTSTPPLRQRENTKNVSLHLSRFLIMPVSHGVERISLATSNHGNTLACSWPRNVVTPLERDGVATIIKVSRSLR